MECGVRFWAKGQEKPDWEKEVLGGVRVRAF